jgi:hypothetical protein
MTTALVHRYVPRGAALDAFHRRDPEILLAGPAGTGKSRACLEKLHLLALSNPGMRGLMVRKTGVSLTASGLVTYREQVAAEAVAAGIVVWYGGSQQEAAQYRFSNGSSITVGGMDRPSKIMSTEYDVAYVQEATELVREDWEAISTRLRYGRLSFQQLLADCNPDRPDHWLKRRCDERATLMLHSKHRDNPRLYDDTGRLTEYGAAYMGRLDALTGVRRLRLRDGLWVAAEGMIYADEWDEATHLVDRFPIPDDWPRYWSVDFGYTHPFVCQRWAEDPDGRLIRYGERFMTRRTVDEHAAGILAVVSRPDPEYRHPDGEERLAHHGRIWVEPKPRAVVCDHDAEGRAQLRKHLGLATTPAVKKVSEGIQAVQKRLRVAGDGRPRLLLMRDSLDHAPDLLLAEVERPTCTEQEVPGYVWAVRPGGNLKEEPVKELDDGCDALRYLVAHRDLRGRPGVRFLN